TAVLILLNEARLLKIGHQDLAYSSWYPRRIGKGLRRGTLLAGPGGKRVFQALQMPNTWATEHLKVLLDFEVGGCEQEDAMGGVAVASGAPDLLNILLQRTGGLVM